MKARIKGECEMREFTPLFSSEGFIGFVDARWYEAHKEKQSGMDVIAPYPIELLIFEEDEKQRLEDFRNKATLEISKALISNTNIVELLESKMYKADLSLEQMVARASVDYANALVDELRRTTVKDETVENHCLTK